MPSVTTAFLAVSDAVSSQVGNGKPAEITLDPSSQHGHQGNSDVFILNADNAKFVLFRSSPDITSSHALTALQHPTSRGIRLTFGDQPRFHRPGAYGAPCSSHGSHRGSEDVHGPKIE